MVDYKSNTGCFHHRKDLTVLTQYIPSFKKAQIKLFFPFPTQRYSVLIFHAHRESTNDKKKQLEKKCLPSPSAQSQIHMLRAIKSN